MLGKQADPTCNVNDILMRMIPVFGNLLRNIVDNDDSIKNDQPDKAG